ncbi:MAG: bestrophin family ion channel [Armatimonadota bacterium]
MIDYDAHKWIDHLFDIKGSMAREIIGRVMTVVGWSAAVVAVHKHVFPIAVPSTLHSLVGVALGLLLVFRTNASYDRFWEGRKAWGGIVNESRNLARALHVFLPERPDLRERALRWTSCFSYAAMHSLRGTSGLGPQALLLPPDEVSRVENATHTPLAAAVQISEAIAEARRDGHLSDYLAATIDNNVQQLIDFLGVCERIHKTPLPFAYVVHLRRALLIYCLTLPFALLDPFGWYTVLDTLLVTYIFFGVEEIGVEIEDPFGVDDNDLPLEAICQTIERSLLQVLDSPTSVPLKGSGSGLPTP